MTAKKLNRRDFLRMSALTAAGVALVRCQVQMAPQPQTAAQPAQDAGAEAPVAAPAGQVALSFWNMPFVTQEVSPEYVLQWEEDAKTALPSAVVDNFYGPGKYKDQRDKFLLQAKSGTPDVIEGLLEDVAAYVEKGLIEPLDEYFNAWDEKDQFVESTLTPLRINGQLWGIPYNTNARGLATRVDILEANGLAVPKSWDELVETARAITEATNKETFGFFTCTEVGDPRAAQEFISWYYQVSGKQNLFEKQDGELIFNGTVEQFEQILDLYGRLFEEVEYPACDPNVRGTGWPVEDPGYVAGKWAMAPMGPWLWGRREEGDVAVEILNNTRIEQLPVAAGGVPATYLEVKPIMMNASAENKDQAWELIKYITSKEKMGLWLADTGGIPARKDSLELPVFDSDLGQWLQMFADQLPIAIAQAPINWGPVSEANLRAVNQVIYGEQNPAEAAQGLYDRINELMANGEI